MSFQGWRGRTVRSDLIRLGCLHVRLYSSGVFEEIFCMDFPFIVILAPSLSPPSVMHIGHGATRLQHGASVRNKERAY